MLRILLALGIGLVVELQATGQEAADPFLWLEEVTGDRALAWVKDRNAESALELTNTEEFKALNGRLLEILDSDEQIPMINKAGDYYYNFWRDGNNKRGLWRRTTLEEYRKAKPNWELVLDLDALAKAEQENWVWRHASFLRPTYDRCMIRLSRGGADAVVVREFDVTTKSFVADGFSLPEAKSDVAWRGRDSVFVATDFGLGSLTQAGYPRIVKEWQRGTPLASATLVYAGQINDTLVGASRDLTRGFERDMVTREISTWRSEQFLRRDGQLIKIETPDDAMVSTHRDLLFIELRTPWTVGNATYAAGTLLATDFEDFMKGNRRLEVLFTPSDRTFLPRRIPRLSPGYSTTRRHIILNQLENVRSRLTILTRKEGGNWEQRELPGVPQFASASADAVEEDESDEYFMTVSDFLTPASLYMGTAGGGAAERLKKSPAYFDSAGIAVSQHEAVSQDGTHVPYFQLAAKDLAFKGKNLTLLSGYGGFGVAHLPAYNPVVGAAWVEKGGVFVLANIRGGGEFGPKWHQAALKENRHRAYEDFIAVAEDLIRRGVTSPKHLGIIGNSNGGLLMGNMLTLRPDLFGAIVCQVPLLDMQRYHKLLSGPLWMDEYGNPDDPQEWKFIRTFSRTTMSGRT